MSCRISTATESIFNMPSNGDIIPPGKVHVNEENQLREANGDGKLEAQKRPKPFKNIYS
jgi:hypothetical protein